ncbi:MAG TPA: class IV adenylate cyclase [Pyrinomonadaceae bacterium]|nr:class IV adenylate cyclase [Pyrinomonadaceae bacterium]
MPLEIEKKYRLTPKQQQEVREGLPAIGAHREGEEFEENTLYAGDALELGQAVLRLRRIDERAVLTYKERVGDRMDVKQQLEQETDVTNPDAVEFILEALGFYPALIYEKRRETWRLDATEIVIDELPFGLFMEIEGEEQAIREIESRLAIKRLIAEPMTYPRLTRQHGVNVAGVIEARFPQ